MRRWTRWFGAALVALGLGACGSDGGDGGSGPGNPAIALSLSKTALTAVQGGSDNLTATITRSGGFTGTVTIETTGAPAGVTAAASNVTTSGGTTTGTVTVTVANNVAAGTYNLTVRASGSGVTAVTVPVTLTVTAIPSSIAVAATPTTLTVAQGATNTVAIALTRTNYTQAVALTVEGAPAGLTANFAPASVTTNSSTLTIGGGTAAAGTYPLTIRATGTGVAAATTVVQLTVTATQPQSSYTLGLSASTLSLAQGASGQVTVNLTRTNFTGNVSLSLQGTPPAGITASFAPPATTGATSTLSVQVGGAVNPGNYDLVVRSEAEGFDPKTATLTLTVTGPAPDYSLSLTPAGTVNVQAGAAAVNVTVNIDRVGGLTAPVALSVGTLPAGLTATFNPASTAGNTSTLTIQAASGAATGAQQITVTGTATGLANKTLNVGVQVAPASGGGGNVSVDVAACPLSDRPLWVAAQNGNGPWTQVVPTGTVYSFNITESRGAVAFVTGSGGSSAVAVQYYSQAEWLGIHTLELCGDTQTGGKTLTAQTAGLGGFTSSATVTIGGGTGTANFAQTLASIEGVANGTFDLVAYRGDLVAGPGSNDRIIIRRDINTGAIANGGSVGPTLDFGAAEAVAPASATATINGGLLGGESIIHTMAYYTGTGCNVHMLYGLGQASSASFPIYGVPAAQQRPTDRHSLFLTASNFPGGGQAGTARGASVFMDGLSATSVTLPGTIAALTPGSESGPYRRFRFQYTLPTGATASATAMYLTVGGSSQAISLMASAAYLGGTAVDLTTPDFSGVAGWNNAWAPATGSTGTWTVSGAGANVTGACPSSGQVLFTSRAGTF